MEIDENQFDTEQFWIRVELWELIEQARRAGKWPYPEPGQP
jgi:hypothetical protein